jgi:hypothetical protein
MPPYTQPARQADQPLARHASDMSHWPCDDILILKEKIDSLERWRVSTEADLREIRDVISQVKLLMALSLGGGGLSIITLLVSLITIAKGLQL